MKLKVYAYAKCGTCKKALQWLDAHGITYETVPIRETPPTVTELRRVMKANGGSVRKLFNTSGSDYKEMNLKERLPAISEDEALVMLARHGNLVKRPVVLGKGVALAGFSEPIWGKIIS